MAKIGLPPISEPIVSSTGGVSPVWIAWLNSISSSNNNFLILATDPDTTNLQVPYIWFNSTSKKLKMWDGANIVEL